MTSRKRNSQNIRVARVRRLVWAARRVVVLTAVPSSCGARFASFSTDRSATTTSGSGSFCRAEGTMDFYHLPCPARAANAASAGCLGFGGSAASTRGSDHDES